MGKLLHAARKFTRYCCIIRVVLSNKISCYMLRHMPNFPCGKMPKMICLQHCTFIWFMAILTTEFLTVILQFITTDITEMKITNSYLRFGP